MAPMTTTTTAAATVNPTIFPVVDWQQAMTQSVSQTLYQQSVAHHYHESFPFPKEPEELLPTSLAGYAFYCDGIVVGFHEANHSSNEKDESTEQHFLQCQSAHHGSDGEETTFECGTYHYNSESQFLSMTSSVFGSKTVLALDLLHFDNILVSFLANDETACHVVSLDWESYSLQDYFGASCHANDKKQHHLALGKSGDVALRSQQVYGDEQESMVVRDYYGVYQFVQNDKIKIYFGPQQSRQAMVLEGSVNENNEITLANGQNQNNNMGPCQHDGTSTIAHVKDLPQIATKHSKAAAPKKRKNFLNGMIKRVVSMVFPFASGKSLEEMWMLFKNSWLLLLRMGFSGKGALFSVPALSVTLTAVLTQLWKTQTDKKWSETTLHWSFVPLVLGNDKNQDQDSEASQQR